MNPYFRTPPIVKNLIIANLVIYIAMMLIPSVEVFAARYCQLYWFTSPLFHSWQYITYMFLHGGFSHLFFNMFALWMFGKTLEYEIGSQRFLTYYMVCGIGAALLQLGVGAIEYNYMVNTYGEFSQAAINLLRVPTVGASGAVFGLLLAFGVMHPNATVMLMIPPIPMKAKWFVVVYGLIELFFGMAGLQSGVAHFAHLGGMLWGFLLLWYWKRRGDIYY